MSEQPYAGFWQRAPAALVDATFYGILSYCVAWLLAAVSQEEWSALFVPASWWLYEAYMTSSKFQATVGKMMVNIAVTDNQGTRITFLRASGRHFFKYLSAAMLLIGFVMAGFTERKQALHDKMAGTLVGKHSFEAGPLIGAVNKLWRGDVPLVISYWVFGVIGGRILSIPTLIFENKGLFDKNSDQFYWEVDLAIFLYFLLVITYTVFVYVGIWRSANNYNGEKVWAALAKVMIILGLIIEFGREFVM